MIRFFLPLVTVLVVSLSSGHTAPDSSSRFLLSGKTTAQGTPEVGMWAAGMPQSGIEGAGFPILKQARHALIFKDAVEAGGYNHHSQLFYCLGVFYAAWSNHPKGEDAAGQRVLFSQSKDGVNWTKWAEAFPPPSEVRGWGEGFGCYAVAGSWHAYEDSVYATARLYNFVGWENADRTSRTAERDEKHIFQRFEHIGLVARKVGSDGTLGPIFALSTRVNRLTNLDFPFVKYGTPTFQPVADAINQRQPKTLTIQGPLPEPVDNARLVEPAVYETPDKTRVAIIRDDKFSHRKYVSFSTNQGSSWSKALPTNIPDSPSLDIALRTPGGDILLIGNHCASGFDNPQDPKTPSNPYHYDRDTLDVAVSTNGYLFTHTVVLRTGVQAWRVPRKAVRGRGGGPQYPSALIMGDKLYVMYSFGKEDIWCSSVPLSDVLQPSAATAAPAEISSPTPTAITN
ncbi:MAG: hypothetical protein B9S32_08975 [Verrucomicrobia bacterium Tous-C9LFEB]|nr:MAG: hypothetical protein B9S32_08975 [Verrucomicrobia bacterium Tous-C9LFEB]